MSSYFFAAMKTKIWKKTEENPSSLEFRGFMEEIFHISHCPPLWCTYINNCDKN